MTTTYICVVIYYHVRTYDFNSGEVDLIQNNGQYKRQFG